LLNRVRQLLGAGALVEKGGLLVIGAT